MAKQVLIEDICDVVNNHWPSGDWYMEDSGPGWDEDGPTTSDRSGKYKPRTPNQLVDLRDFDFVFCWQGRGPEPQNGVPANFVSLFNRVQRAKTHVRVFYDVPKDAVEKADVAMKKLGGKRIA